MLRSCREVGGPILRSPAGSSPRSRSTSDLLSSSFSSSSRCIARPYAVTSAIGGKLFELDLLRHFSRRTACYPCRRKAHGFQSLSHFRGAVWSDPMAFLRQRLFHNSESANVTRAGQPQFPAPRLRIANRKK